jgi:hypothetical protein
MDLFDLRPRVRSPVGIKLPSGHGEWAEQQFLHELYRFRRFFLVSVSHHSWGRDSYQGKVGEEVSGQRDVTQRWCHASECDGQTGFLGCRHSARG